MITDCNPDLSPFVDEWRIEAQNNLTLHTEHDLRDHLLMINECFKALSELLRLYPHKSEDELIVLRLGVRVLNDAGASLKNARSGYYQPALALVRDMIETGFLLVLFKREPARIQAWTTATERVRKRDFGPAAVRKRLDELDGHTQQVRQTVYSEFSIYAAHPHPRGFSVISPNDMTEIGPFPDRDRVKACVDELVRHFTNIVLGFLGHIPHEEAALAEIKARFLATLDPWMRTYMPL